MSRTDMMINIAVKRRNFELIYGPERENNQSINQIYIFLIYL